MSWLAAAWMSSQEKLISFNFTCSSLISSLNLRLPVSFSQFTFRTHSLAYQLPTHRLIIHKSVDNENEIPIKMQYVAATECHLARTNVYLAKSIEKWPGNRVSVGCPAYVLCTKFMITFSGCLAM